MSFEVPSGLTELLQDFTIAVLRERPAELVVFASEYFNHLRDSHTLTNSNHSSDHVKKSGNNFHGHDTDEENIVIGKYFTLVFINILDLSLYERRIY